MIYSPIKNDTPMQAMIAKNTVALSRAPNHSDGFSCGIMLLPFV